MTPFRCIPIETSCAERFRRTGRDDRGNALRTVPVTGTSGFPCRHCLRYGEPGQAMLLGSYDPPRPVGIYWTPSPIFVHAEACARYDGQNEVAPIVRGSLVSIRAYDADDQCLYDLGEACPGETVDTPLSRAIGNARTAFVNIHTARPGCLLTRVERLAA